MSRRFLILIMLVAASALVGCKQPDDAAKASPTMSSDADATPADTAAPPPDDGVSMRYRCDGGHAVAIVRGELARVTLADGRVVEISRVADSAPPAYRGEALSFEVGSQGATLGQDEVGGSDCRADE
jgi:hypothetical protein